MKTSKLVESSENFGTVWESLDRKTSTSYDLRLKASGDLWPTLKYVGWPLAEFTFLRFNFGNLSHHDLNWILFFFFCFLCKLPLFCTVFLANCISLSFLIIKIDNSWHFGYITSDNNTFKSLERYMLLTYRLPGMKI